MTPGNLELVEILASWAATAPIVYAVIVLDERRLSGEMLARAWPPVSRDAALFAAWLLGYFPPYLLALFLVHFGRTRRSAWGYALGLAWTLASVGVLVASQLAADAVVDAAGG
jgi:hypothetical protein